jgi:hypothetical protein
VLGGRIFCDRFEHEIGIGERVREVLRVRAAVDRLRRDLALGELLGARPAGFCLVERPREKGCWKSGSGKHRTRASTHGAVGTEDDDLAN